MNTRTFDEKIVQRYSWKDENSIGHGDWLAKSSLATSAFETVKKESKKKKMKEDFEVEMLKSFTLTSSGCSLAKETDWFYMLIYRKKRKVNNKKLNKETFITQGLEVLTQIIAILNPSYRCSSLFLFYFFILVMWLIIYVKIRCLVLVVIWYNYMKLSQPS